MMNLIKDIRFSSKQPDPILDQFYIHGMKDIIQRLLFLLRHEGFSFGSFDHLYMNYTSSLPHGQVQRSGDPVSGEFSWLQYADAGCDLALFHAMAKAEQRQFLAQSIRQAVWAYADQENRTIFDRCYARVMKLGPDLEIPYKEKAGAHLRIAISTTIGDDVQFQPIIRIYDVEDTLLLEERLKRCSKEAFLAQFGTISLGKRTVRIEPRKSWHLQGQKVSQLKFSV